METTYPIPALNIFFMLLAEGMSIDAFCLLFYTNKMRLLSSKVSTITFAVTANAYARNFAQQVNKTTSTPKISEQKNYTNILLQPTIKKSNQSQNSNEKKTDQEKKTSLVKI